MSVFCVGGEVMLKFRNSIHDSSFNSFRESSLQSPYLLEYLPEAYSRYFSDMLPKFLAGLIPDILPKCI